MIAGAPATGAEATDATPATGAEATDATPAMDAEATGETPVEAIGGTGATRAVSRMIANSAPSVAHTETAGGINDTGIAAIVATRIVRDAATNAGRNIGAMIVATIGAIAVATSIAAITGAMTIAAIIGVTTATEIAGTSTIAITVVMTDGIAGPIDTPTVVTVTAITALAVGSTTTPDTIRLDGLW